MKLKPRSQQNPKTNVDPYPPLAGVDFRDEGTERRGWENHCPPSTIPMKKTNGKPGVDFLHPTPLLPKDQPTTPSKSK
jgi:hypothetical protein